jgi:hypothetical protein
MTALGTAHVDSCDNLVELSIGTPGDEASWSILLSPAQWSSLVDQGEHLPSVMAYRRRQSIEAAKEAASHRERGAS